MASAFLFFLSRSEVAAEVDRCHEAPEELVAQIKRYHQRESLHCSLFRIFPRPLFGGINTIFCDKALLQHRVFHLVIRVTVRIERYGIAAVC